MGIFKFISHWVVRHRPDSLSRGSPHGPRQGRARKLASTLVPAICIVLSLTTVAEAATSQTAKNTINSNGVYTIIAVDEAGNKTYRTVTISNIFPKPTVDEDGNVLPDDETPDQDYTEDIVATLVNDTIVNSNGTYSVMVIDEAGNIVQQSVTVRNIEQPTTEPGKDEEGNLTPEVPDTEEDYTEDIAETLTGTQAVTTNGQFTAFVRDEAGNLTRRTYTVTNILEEKEPDPEEPIVPDDVPDTDEDYTEDIQDTMSGGSTVTTNGTYSATVFDEAGNLTIVDIRVENIFESTPDDPGPEPDPDKPIVPDDVPDTDEDYTEDILSELSKQLHVTESGIYAAIVRDETGNLEALSATVTINEDPNPPQPGIDPIEPDQPGEEFPSPDGSSMTDTKTVYENGFYSAGGVDNVGNIGLETIMVRNIGAPDVKIVQNPATLIRKTAEDGSTYGEATITFTCVSPDGALLEYVRAVDEEDNEIPLDHKNGLYTMTVTKNGIYRILAADVTGRDGEYPVFVDYIYELETEAQVDAMEGTIVELEANVVGGAPEKFQWYTCDADGSNAQPIIGEAGEVYAFKATFDRDDTYYMVVATKGDYVVVSKPIHLTVYFAPILQTRGYVIAAEGFDFNLTVGKKSTDTVCITTDGNPSDYSYQWYYAIGSRGQKIPIAGATEASYTDHATANMNGYFYFCEIKTSKCSVMSDPIYLYVCGKPTAPIIQAHLKDGTEIPSDTWSVNAPLLVTIGNSTAAGTVGTIEYKYSYDQIHWFNYEEPIVFEESTEITTVYAKAVNVALTTVDSDISEHIVKIELEDPTLHPSEEDVVPGVRYDQTTWVNHPRPIHLYVNTLSGVGEISVYFKGEHDADYHMLVNDEGESIYTLDGELVDGEHFTCTRLEKGLWRIDFGAAENGWYQVKFKDIAHRPLDSVIGTQPFEVKNIDYGIPTVASATLDNEGKANEKTISVLDAHDEYSASKYGYSELYGYGYSKDTDVPPAKGDPTWTAFTSSNSSYTVDENGTRHYNFDIHLAGHDDNGTYHIWVIDNAGNTSIAKVVEVDGLYDKMQDVKFDKSTLDLTVPIDGIVKVTFKGEPASIDIVSSNTDVVTGRYEMADPEVCNVFVTPVDYGKATITITLRDYDGTEYNHNVSVTVKNMIPSVKNELSDITVKPNTDATFKATFEGTNLTYQWYKATSPGGSGELISENDPAYVIGVEDTDASLHTVTLTIKEAAPELTNTYYWCVATASEGTPAYVSQTRTARLTVVGSVSLPTITANNGTVTSGQWTHLALDFIFSGSNIAAGSGTVGYQYRYDDEETWSNSSGNLTYTGDTHEKTLYVRAYNTLDAEVVSDEATFIIRVDTVMPEIAITGNPTDWVSTDQTLTAVVTDADSGITDDSIKMTVTGVKADGTTATGTVTPEGDGKTYKFTIGYSAVYKVIVHDQAGNELSTELIVNKIDRAPPTVAITQGSPDSNLCPVTIYATDDASTQSELLYTFDGGLTWTQANMQILTLNKTYVIGAKDAAGNIATRPVKITGNNSSGGNNGGGGGSKPELITSSILNVADFKLGKDYYISVSATGVETQHEYETHEVNGENVKCLPVEIEAYPAAGGYISGYAKLSTGPRFPIYWEEGATSTSAGGTGMFYIKPDTLTTSVKNGTITVTVTEYETEDLAKVLNRDTMKTPIMIDVNGPTVNISLDPISNQITITARDALSGLDSVQYAVKDQSGAVSAFVDYTGPFTKPEGCKQIIVQATDKCGNISTTESVALDGSGGGIGGNVTGDAYEHAYYYRTSMFNYWLIGSNQTNTD